MEKTKEHLADSAPPKGGVARDVQRLKEDGGASLAEMREFVGRMQGKSPQEMLGVLAQSRLVVSIAISTVGCVAILFVWSVAAYVIGTGADSADKSTTTVAAKTEKPAASPKKTAAGSKTTPVAATPGAKVPVSKTDDIAKRLGIKETKSGVPNLDNLLDNDK